MIGLTLRLTLLLSGTIVLIVLLLAGAWLWQGRDDERNLRLPLPEQVSAIVEVLDQTSPAQRERVLRALRSDGLDVSLDRRDDAAAGNAVRQMPALGWMVSRYSVALGDRAVQADVVGGALRRRLRLSTHLQDGTPLRIEMRGDMLRRLRGRHMLVLLALALTVTAGLSAWGLRRQIRPIEQLADALDRYGTDDERPLPPPSGAPEVRRLQDAFARASERVAKLMDDRARLFAAISHDLGTYLTRLSLRIDGMGDEGQRRRAEQDVQQMSALLRDLLSLARLQSTRGAPESALQRVDLSELLRDETDAVNARYGEGAASLHGAAAAQPAWLQADPGLLRRLLANLLDNAVKYGNTAEVTLGRDHDGLALTIDDHGPGIPDADMQRVFEPFYRSDGARNMDRPGSGLGLAIAAEAVKRHGGSIRLSNRVEGGLSVQVWLPMTRGL